MPCPEFAADGFPTNDREDEDCDLPDGFERFDCEYDLLGLDVSMDNIDGLSESAGENIQNSPLISALCSGQPGFTGAGGGSGAPPTDPATALQQAGLDLASLGPMGVLVMPEYLELCGLRIDMMCRNTQLIGSFIPTIIEAAAKVTRKLTVRISWGDDEALSRTLTIETFLTSFAQGEEELEKL